MKKSESQNYKKSQADKFREAAKEMGTDDDETRFDDNLRKIMNAPVRQDGDTLVAQISGTCPRCSNADINVPIGYSDDTIITCAKCTYSAPHSDFFADSASHD